MAVHPNFLARVALFSTLPDAWRHELAQHMQRVELARRAVALEKGRRGQGMGFVVTGRLQAVDFTLDGREVGLYFVSAGDFFGELAVVDGGTAPEFVIAITPTTLLHLPDAAAREVLLKAPGVAEAIARRLAQRVREGIAQRRLLALGNPMQRLAAQLLALAGEGQAIEQPPTHQELAIMINTTRETVSRCFQSLVQQGTLRRDGERLQLCDRSCLEAFLQRREGAK